MFVLTTPQVLQGCFAGYLNRVEGTKEVEYEHFDGGLWKVGLSMSWLTDYTREELRRLFGRQQLLDGRCGTCPPPRPMFKDAFIQRAATCMVKYIPHGNLQPLDSNSSLKLLGNDGWLVDFSCDAVVGETLSIGHGVRRATAQDRLYFHMPHPLPLWSNPECLELAHALYTYFAQGGRTLAEAPNPVAEARRHRVLQLLPAAKAASTVLRVYSEILDSDELALTKLVIDSRIVSGVRGFVEMPMYTGPPNSGKTLLANGPIVLLGGPARMRGATSYVESLPNNFLCVPDRADGNASKPVLNKCRNKRLLVVTECPALPILGDVCKPLLDTCDAGINARANHSTQHCETTFGVSWSVICMRNSALELCPNSAYGMRDKILEFQPPFAWVANPQPDSRERLANRDLADGFAEGRHNAEVLFWARALFPILGLSKSRHMDPPRPRCFRQFEEDASENALEGRLRTWIRGNLETCKAGGGQQAGGGGRGRAGVLRPRGQARLEQRRLGAQLRGPAAHPGISDRPLLPAGRTAGQAPCHGVGGEPWSRS